MTWRDTIATSLDAVRTHRLRSALTMLGILIGIAAVILTVGLGQGAQAAVRDEINQLGTNLLVISPGSSTDESGVRGGFGTASTLTVQDAAALQNEVVAPDILAVAPASTTQTSVTTPDTNWTSTLIGTTPSWSTVRSRDVSSGRFLTDDDDATTAAVVVLGPDTAQELFGNVDPIGEAVTVEGLQLEVVGVLESLRSSEETSNNDMAVVPLSTYNERMVGGSDRDSVDNIYVKAQSDDFLSAAYQETSQLLLNLHDIAGSQDADFQIATQDSILSAASSVDQTMTILLAGIAIISLLVGGIGVMNIMLVSVNERIREIGLRKALGARPSVIRRQFLVEASVLGFWGGVFGVGLGAIGAGVLPKTTDSEVILSFGVSVLAVVMAIGIGVAFGVYPASRAARLAPIDALRSE
jgi:putative ABC transport system permease protein